MSSAENITEPDAAAPADACPDCGKSEPRTVSLHDSSWFDCGVCGREYRVTFAQGGADSAAEADQDEIRKTHLPTQCECGAKPDHYYVVTNRMEEGDPQSAAVEFTCGTTFDEAGWVTAPDCKRREMAPAASVDQDEMVKVILAVADAASTEQKQAAWGPFYEVAEKLRARSDA